MTSTIPLPLPLPVQPADLDERTCCPEDEIIPCSACDLKHKADEAALLSLTQLLPPVAVEASVDFSDLKQAAASLLRVSPPEIPHGHAASAPEDIAHHQAHARQLPAPGPPDPRTAASEKSAGPLLAQPATERTDGGGAADRSAETEEPTCCPEEAELVPCSACFEKHAKEAALLEQLRVEHSAPSLPSTTAAAFPVPAYSAVSSPSPLPATYALTANTVDFNAGVGTQSLYNVGSAMPFAAQPQQQQQPAQPYGMQPSLYGAMAYNASSPPPVMYAQPMQPQQAQQHVDVYGGLYQQQLSGLQMPQQQQAQFMYQPYAQPVTMAGPNGGTLVYYPAQSGANESSVQPALQQLPIAQPPAQQMGHQMPPPGLMSYYQQTQSPPQPQLQLAQPQHSVAAQQPAPLAFQQQQPAAYVNNIPVYYTTQPPQPQQHPMLLEQQPTQHHHALYLPASAPASTVTSPAPSVAGDSVRSYGESDKSCATYKTEICRSHQYSGACEYGASCQFAHGLDELRTREVDPKYKTERCKNYHAFGPATCWYGPRCKFIHDEYRVRVGEREFWLISPRENMVRVEKVEAGNSARLHQLCALIVDQTGPAQQAAQQLMAQMAAHTQKERVDGAAEQLGQLGLGGAEQHSSTGAPAASKHDTAARFLRAIVSPHSGSAVSTPINVQAMQVVSSSAPFAAKFGPAHSHSNPTTPRTHNPLLPRGLPCPTSLSHGHSHQQPSARNTLLSFPAASSHPPSYHRRPSPHTNPYGAYNHSPLSVLSSLLTPRALHSMLAMNAGVLGGAAGGADEPVRARRRRVRKKKSRSLAGADRESGSSDAQDEQTAHSDDDNGGKADKDDDNDSEAAADSQQQQQRLPPNQQKAATQA